MLQDNFMLGKLIIIYMW